MDLVCAYCGSDVATAETLLNRCSNESCPYSEGDLGHWAVERSQFVELRFEGLGH